MSPVLANIQPNGRFTNDAGPTLASTSLDAGSIEARRQSALENITQADRLLSRAELAANTIQSILGLIDSTTEQLNTLNDNNNDDSETRTRLIDEINALGDQINDQVDLALYEQDPLLDGSFSGENRLVFSTGFTNGGVTRLPDFINLRPQGASLDLGQLLSSGFQADVDGTFLSEDSDSFSLSQFGDIVAESLNKVESVLSSAQNTTERLSKTAVRIREFDTFDQNETSDQSLLGALATSLQDADGTTLTGLSAVAVFTQGNLSTKGILNILNTSVLNELNPSTSET